MVVPAAIFAACPVLTVTLPLVALLAPLNSLAGKISLTTVATARTTTRPHVFHARMHASLSTLRPRRA